MGRDIPLSNKIGELMAPGTIVTAFLIDPNGKLTVDAGALHGRSAIESKLRMVRERHQLKDAATWRVVWVAVETDTGNRPVRYKGLSVCELLVDLPARAGYKSLADHVNRMGEAMRGDVNVARLGPEERRLVRAQLQSIASSLWDASDEQLKGALG